MIPENRVENDSFPIPKLLINKEDIACFMKELSHGILTKILYSVAILPVSCQEKMEHISENKHGTYYCKCSVK